MRKNVELKKEWLHKIRHCDEYGVKVFMMFCDDVLSLSIDLIVDGEIEDTECVMSIENADEPTSEMMKKFKSLVKYFSEHFENVQGKTEVIRV